MDSASKALEKTDVKLPWREKFGWATGDFAQNLIYTTISTYLLFFYTNVYGLPAADAATMFLVVRLIDAINDPIVGTIVDKHTTRWGKYRGWLLYMSIPLAVLAMLLFPRAKRWRHGQVGLRLRDLRWPVRYLHDRQHSLWFLKRRYDAEQQGISFHEFRTDALS